MDIKEDGMIDFHELDVILKSDNSKSSSDFDEILKTMQQKALELEKEIQEEVAGLKEKNKMIDLELEKIYQKINELNEQAKALKEEKEKNTTRINSLLMGENQVFGVSLNDIVQREEKLIPSAIEKILRLIEG